MLVPEQWTAVEGLSCGFGDRDDDAVALARDRALDLVTVKQVHGCRVMSAETAAAATGLAEADALFVTTPGTVVAVRTADCVPVLMLAADRTGPRWAAAVHAGWRGTVAGIARRAVELADEAGVAAADLDVALGPSIGACCYEVGHDVASRFDELGLPVVPAAGSGRARLDLRTINTEILVAAGVERGRIAFVGPCTRCTADLYYSHRADPSCTGRQLSWIGWS